MVDLFWILLNGGGVGSKAISGCLNGFLKPIPELEIINTKRKDKGGNPKNVETYDPISKVWKIVIGDSGEAWAKSIGKLLAGKYDAEKLILDFSEIRPKGSVLSRYGWISSGDTVISEEYKKIFKLLNRRADSLLSCSDINDIINHLGVIQTGRRGAEILQMDSTHTEIDEFINFKANAMKDPDLSHRFQSNNSVMYWNKPSRSELEKIFENMVKNGGGDPGLVNGENTRRDCPWFKVFNPCVTGDTVILTKDGNQTIENIVDKEIQIWNGDQWSTVKPYSTGINEIVKVSFSDGTEITCTPYHRWPIFEGFTNSGNMEWVETKDLQEGMKLKKHNLPENTINETHYENIECMYSQGFYSADGNKNSNQSWVYEPKNKCIEKLKGTFGKIDDNQKRRSWKHGPMMSKDWFPINCDKNTFREWFAGLLDGDGHITKDGNVQLTSVDLDFLKLIKLEMTRFGWTSKITIGRCEGKYSLPDGKDGIKEYECKTTYRLLISSMNYFDMDLNTKRLNKIEKPNRDASRFVFITNVEYLQEDQETFCMTEPLNNMFIANGIITGNCVEAALANKGLCNLVEINLNNVENIDDFMNTARLVGRANYRQTLVNLQDGILQDQWHQNNQFIRLCGVSMTGGFARQDITAEDYQKAKEMAIEGTDSMADELGLSRAKAVTLGKPGGTVPKLMGVPSGNNAPKGKYIFNQIIFGKDSPETTELRNAGYEIIDHPNQSVNVLVKFPVKFDVDDNLFTMKNGCLVPDEDAIQQLERYKFIMSNWTQQNTSNTIEYEPEEVPAIIDWLLENWEIYKGVAFMFKNDYTRTPEECGFPYLPEQVVTKEDYDQYLTKLKPIDWSKFVGATNDLDTLEGCEGGGCPTR